MYSRFVEITVIQSQIWQALIFLPVLKATRDTTHKLQLRISRASEWNFFKYRGFAQRNGERKMNVLAEMFS